MPLTTGVDSIVGTSGNDTITANPVSTLTGSNTSTTTYPATQQIDKIVVSGTITATDTFEISYKGVTVISEAAAGTNTSDAAIVIANAINLAAGSNIASSAGDTVVIAAQNAGTALPYYSNVQNAAYYFVDVSGTAASTNMQTIQSNQPSYTQTNTNNTYTVTSAVNPSDVVDGGDGYDTAKVVSDNEVIIGKATVKNVEALDITSGSNVNADVSEWDASLQTVKISAQADVTATTRSTTNISATTSSGSVTTTGGNDITVNGATGSVNVNLAKGAVSIDVQHNGDYTSYYGSVYVSGGTTVSINKAAAKLDSITGQPTGLWGYPQQIQVGEDALYAAASTTVDGYPEIDTNAKYQPTGNVTINLFTDYVDTNGQAQRLYNDGTALVYSNGATDVNVANSGVITIKDVQTATRKATATSTAVAGTSTLSSVTIDGSDAAASVISDALTALKLVNTGASSAVTVTNATTTGHALALTLGNNASGTSITDDTATSVTVTTEAQALSTVANASKATVDLNAAKATSLVFNNAQAVVLSGSSTLDGTTKVTAIDLNGVGKVTLGDVTAATKLTSIDATDSTGGVAVTIGSTGSYGMSVKGGAGADTVTLKASSTLASALVNGVTVSTSIDLGAGNDKLLNAGTAASGSATVGVGTVIDAGDGVDTVSASLVAVGNAGLFKNFETVDLKGAASGGALDAALMTNSSISGVALSGATGGGTFTVSNLAGTDVKLTVTDNSGSSVGDVYATLASSAGTSDIATLTFAATSSGATTGSVLGKLKTTGIETLNIASGGTLAVSTDTIKNTLTVFEDASNKTAAITVSGSNAFVLGAYTDATNYTDGVEQYTSAPTTAIADATTAAGLKTIDASAATAAVTIVAGETQADVHGASTTDLVFTGLVITGGAGADKLVNLAAAGVVNGGAGKDAITVTGSAAVVDGGAGDDTITVNAAVSTTLTGGAGKDKFAVAAATASSTFATAPKTTTITDLALGDILSLGTTTALIKASAAITSATTLIGAIDAALEATTLITGITANVAQNTAAWFTYGGNTYVVREGDATDGLSASDVVVKLTGVFDLSTATLASDVITIA